VIHRQTCRGEIATAMVAYAEGPLALPPVAGTKLSRFAAFAPDFFFTDWD
jgi:hypothetical protein